MKTHLEELREGIGEILYKQFPHDFIKVIENVTQLKDETEVIEFTIRKYDEAIEKDVEALKVIAQHGYGEDDGTEEIKLTKYLIDRKEVIQLIRKGINSPQNHTAKERVGSSADTDSPQEESSKSSQKYRLPTDTKK